MTARAYGWRPSSGSSIRMVEGCSCGGCRSSVLRQMNRSVPPESCLEPFQLDALAGVMAVYEVEEERRREPSGLDDALIVDAVPSPQQAQEGGEIAGIRLQAQVVAHGLGLADGDGDAGIVEVIDAPTADGFACVGCEVVPLGVRQARFLVPAPERVPEPAIVSVEVGLLALEAANAESLEPGHGRACGAPVPRR